MAHIHIRILIRTMDMNIFHPEAELQYTQPLYFYLVQALVMILQSFQKFQDVLSIHGL
jgi:hypothetical protein